MEININQLIESRAPVYSHSVHEGGEDAAQNSWNAAKEAAASAPILRSEEELEAMRGWARSSGGWEREEIAAWDADELNALFLQLVSAETREAGWDSLDEAQWTDDGELIARFHDVPEEEWEPAECSNIFRGTDGNFYFSLYE
jgi:hypothetical protein